MDNCLLHGKRICALWLRNEHNMDVYEFKREWKKAQYRNELICEDCGTPVELRAGDVKVPYFAHRKGFVTRDCYYETYKETEEHREAKSLLYEYFCANYPDAVVEVTKKHPNGRRSDIFIDFDTSKLAVEFQRTNLKISDWDERHFEYEKLGIIDLWLLSSGIYDKQKNDFDFLTQVLLHETKDNSAKFLDVKNKSLKLIKAVQFLDRQGKLKNRIFVTRDYDLFNITISPDGQILCDFEQHYSNAKQKFIKECEEAEAKEMIQKRADDWFRRQDELRAQSRKNSDPQVSNPSSFNKVEKPSTPPEPVLESKIKDVSGFSEFRDHEIIKDWIDQLQSIKETSSLKGNSVYEELMLDCERIIMGYRYNGYIAGQNAKRLEIKLKQLIVMVTNS